MRAGRCGERHLCMCHSSAARRPVHAPAMPQRPVPHQHPARVERTDTAQARAGEAAVADGRQPQHRAKHRTGRGGSGARSARIPGRWGVSLCVCVCVCVGWLVVERPSIVARVLVPTCLPATRTHKRACTRTHTHTTHTHTHTHTTHAFAFAHARAQASARCLVRWWRERSCWAQTRCGCRGKWFGVVPACVCVCVCVCVLLLVLW
jgi:hypothetical protein